MYYYGTSEVQRQSFSGGLGIKSPRKHEVPTKSAPKSINYQNMHSFNDCTAPFYLHPFAFMHKSEYPQFVGLRTHRPGACSLLPLQQLW